MLVWRQVSNLIEGGHGSPFQMASSFSVMKQTKCLVDHEYGKEGVKVGGEQSECKIFTWENRNQEPE